MRILRLKEVKARTGLSRSSIYRGIATGDFPKNYRLSARSVGFLESEVEAWIEGKVVRARTDSDGARSVPAEGIRSIGSPAEFQRLMAKRQCEAAQ